MGLDQYAYVAAKAGARDAYYDDVNYAKDDTDPTKIGEPRELSYWRKHPNLQGHMEQLWIKKNLDLVQDHHATGASFNCVELELTWEDIDELEQAVRHNQLPKTTGFFFGSPSDNYYFKQDLAFVQAARAELFLGLKVFYNSSW